jgi:hypothetical protein
MLRILLVLLGLLGLPASAFCKSPYYVELSDVRLEGAPPELGSVLVAEAKAVYATLIAKRPGFVATLTGAPDRNAAPAEFQKYLTRRHIRAFAVALKVRQAERSLLPAKAGQSGQVLRFYLELSLLGSAIPDATLALSGNGTAQIDLEVGQTVQGKDDAYARKEALTIAIGNALDEAVAKLEAKTQPVPRRKGTKKP